MKRLFSLILLFLCIQGSLFSLEKNTRLRFECLSIQDGLSQSTVHCIIQDRQGFLWFGTEDGLNKYDGYTFTQYRQIPGNPNDMTFNSVRVLHQDRDGIIWIGTDIGLYKLDPVTDLMTCYRPEPGRPNSLSHDYVSAIVETDDGMLWIGTRRGGLNKFDPKTNNFTIYRNIQDCENCLSSDSIISLKVDHGGMLLIGTLNNGLDILDPKTGTFKHFPGAAGNGNVNSIVEDAGFIWMGTERGGLIKLNPDTGVFTQFRVDPTNPASLSHDRVAALYKDSSGRIWIATDAALDLWEPDTQSFRHFQAKQNDPFSMSNNLVCSIYEDRSGIFWIGTRGGGVNKLDFRKNQFNHYHYNTKEPNGVVVFSIFEDQAGFLWIGTSGGLYKYGSEKKLLAHYRYIPGNPNSLAHDNVRAIQQDAYGYLWIGTYGGVSRLDPQTGTFTNYANNSNSDSLSHNQVLTICMTQPDTIWFGTAMGLNRFDVERNRFSRIPMIPGEPEHLGTEMVKCLYQDRSGVLWVGTLGRGFSKFDPQTKTFTHYRHSRENPNSLSHNFILCIHEDAAGNLWIGTFGGGLNKFNPQTETFTHYTMREGLPNDVIYGILEDENGNLWLSSNFGLSRFNPYSVQFKNYSAADGLQSNEFNGGAYFRSKSGELFFGGIKGFNAFYPGKIVDNPYVPPVVITSFMKLNKKVILPRTINYTKALTLSYRDYVFSFEFAVLDYSAPEKNKYAYKMEGLDEDWITTSADKRFVSYTTLEPGTYVFRVKGANNDGKWNKEGTSIKITITPPYWKTWWFQVLAVLFLAVVLYISHRARMANVTLRLKTEAEMNRIFDKYSLSDREKEIIKLLLKGKSNKDVESELYISLKTVKSHIYNIYQKLGVKTRLELIHLIQTSVKKR